MKPMQPVHSSDGGKAYLRSIYRIIGWVGDIAGLLLGLMFLSSGQWGAGSFLVIGFGGALICRGLLRNA
ncbi:MAG: hypothetical protein JWM57_2790 [Phycisphaerales bacterium]|nr:hypothetical protein [Phycisphaerales bacterium]